MRSPFAATLGLSLALVASAPASHAAPTKPRASYLSTSATIPREFQGHWDELDECSDREPRYQLGEQSFGEFEVSWDVERVELRSPTRITIHTVTVGVDDGKTYRAAWNFELVRGRRALKHWPSGRTRFLPCRYDTPVAPP